MDHRKLYRIGVNFSLEKRSIDGWKIEEVKSEASASPYPSD